MRWIYILAASMMFLAACNGNQNTSTDEQISVVEESQKKERKTPEFTGTIDSARLKTIMTHYFTVKNALIDGNTNAAALTGKEAHQFMGAEQDEVLRNISENFKTIGETEEIETQRKFFYLLSEYLYAVTITVKPDTATLYKQYCPMAFDDTGAWWISDDEEVVNPYFGEEMLHCGMVQKQW